MIKGYCYRLYCTAKNGEELIERTVFPASDSDYNADILQTPADYTRDLVYYYMDEYNPASKWRYELSECEFDAASDGDINDDYTGESLSESITSTGETTEDEVAEYFAPTHDDYWRRTRLADITRELHEPKTQLWYAVMHNEDDTDWGTGSFDFDKAVAIAKDMGENSYIAAIDGKYDVRGKQHTDTECVETYYNGEDF